jgi:hypothetical protein
MTMRQGRYPDEPFIPGPFSTAARPGKLERLQYVREQYADGKINHAVAVQLLMTIYPRITMADAAGWHRLLTED